MAKSSNATRSLDQYIKDKKRETCVVCKLPVDVRTQIRAARERKVPRATVLAWLKAEFSITITDEDMSRHVGGRHD